MSKLSSGITGVLYAVGAAALNGSIGLFSKSLINIGIGPSSIAFVKTIFGCIILTSILLFLGKNRSRTKWWQSSICAFLGIFTLFFFETAAYDYDLAANVVVTLMAFASISALVFSWPILGEKPLLEQWMGFVLAIVGVSAIIGIKNTGNVLGIFFAAIAGCGYGLFSVLVKKMKLEGGLLLTKQLLFYGAIFLFFPAYINGFEKEIFQFNSLVALVALAVMPTILGFYCTTKAIQLLSPARVQILELSEPLFATILALVFLGEVPGLETWFGGSLIVLGLATSSGVLKLPFLRAIYK